MRSSRVYQVFAACDRLPLPCKIYLEATRQLRNNREHAQFGKNVIPKMADKLVVLTFLLLFIGFRPTISDGVLNQEGKSLKRIFATNTFLDEYIF